MGKVLILSNKPLLEKEEEEALARDNVQVMALSNYDEDLLENIDGDFDYIVLKNSLGGVGIYQVCHVANVTGA